MPWPTAEAPTLPETQHPMRPLVQAWFATINAALKYKDDVYQRAANECKRFLAGGTKLNDFMWGTEGAGRGGYVPADGEDSLVAPTFRFTTNKVAELLQLFGPNLYNRNPVRTATPRAFDPVDPMTFAALNPQLYAAATNTPPVPPPGSPPLVQQQALQAQQQQQQAIMQLQAMIQQSQQQDAMTQTLDKTTASLLEEMLNYTPIELDLKRHSRLVVDEALMKGAGVWWTELFEAPGSQTKLVGSFYDTFDNVLLDPDVEVLDDCKWVARRCIHPQWEVEREYGLPANALDGAIKPDSVKARNEGQIPSDSRSDAARQRRGQTNDLIVYWKLYSKMGLGGRQAGLKSEVKTLFDGFGDYCYLVLCEGIPYALNLPSQMMIDAPPPVDQTGQPNTQATSQWLQGIQQSLAWPIPFYEDGKSWPFTECFFHPQPNCVYPYSHVSAGLGELKWLNWTMSFLASKVRGACTTIVAVRKDWDEQEKKKAITGIDMRVVEVDMTSSPNGKITDLVSYLQTPAFHKDLYEVWEMVAAALDKRWGLNEQLYGNTPGATPRSATDVQVRQGNTSIRLDDMQQTVQEAMTKLARKEALAMRWLLDANDVAPILGQVRAQLWAQLVQTADPGKIVRELEYRIESGSMTKPNTEAKIQAMNQMAQSLMPFLEKVAVEWGEVGPWNALMEDWGKALQLDVRRYMIQPPQPPQPEPGAQGGAPASGPSTNGNGQKPPPRQGQHGTRAQQPRVAA